MEDQQEIQEGYTPRPLWQIIAAWVGVAVMLVCVVLWLYQIATGGR